MLKNLKGFTLIEMLIVLMIISILIILIVPNLKDKGEEVFTKGCNALASLVQAQVDTYYLENKEYPEALDDLVDKSYITEDQLACQYGELDYNEGKVTPPNNEKE